jgi:hypothetical protein
LDKDTGMVKIPGERLVWYVNELEGAAWQGNSIFRAAYGLWSLKNRALRVNAIKDERNGMGIPKYTGAPSEQDLSKGKQLANDLRGGESAGAAIPNGSTLELMGVTGTLPDVLASLNFYNEGMARVMLTQFLNLGTTKTGSRALGDSFIDFFKMALDAVTGNIADTVTCHVIEPLVNWNYGEDTACTQTGVRQRRSGNGSAARLVGGARLVRCADERRRHRTVCAGTVPSPETVRTLEASAKAGVCVRLPNLPVTARARERAVQAKSSGSKADTLAEADRARTHVEQVHKALLKPAWLSMVGHADLTPVVRWAGGACASATVVTHAAADYFHRGIGWFRGLAHRSSHRSSPR